VVSWLLLAWVKAATESPDPFDLGMLIQYGVLGIAAGALSVFARVAYRRETERADRLEAEVIRLNSLIIERAIPALTSAAQAAEDATSLLRDMQREREISMIRDSARRQPRPGEDRL